MLIDSLVGVLLTDGGEGAEEEEGTGVSVELMGGEEQVKYSELRTSVLASKRDTLYRSFQPPWLAVASSFGADLDSRHPDGAARCDNADETETILARGGRSDGGGPMEAQKVTRPPPRFMMELCKRYNYTHT